MQVTTKFTIGEKLQKTFSITGRIPSPVFKLGSARLRFEISEEIYSDKIGMMLNVMRKTEAIFNTAFENSKKVWIVLEFFSPKKLEKNQLPQGFKDLIENCQYTVDPNEVYELNEFKISEKEDEGYFYVYAIEKEPDFNSLKSIIWAIGGKEIGIKPTADVSAFFIDFNQEIIFHLYDDRGLDVISNKKETLRECYDLYSQWILEHNRKEVEQSLK